MVWANSRAFRRLTHSWSCQVVPPLAPQPRTDTPKELDPIQVSVSVVVSAGAKTLGAATMVWRSGVTLLLLMVWLLPALVAVGDVVVVTTGLDVDVELEFDPDTDPELDPADVVTTGLDVELELEPAMAPDPDVDVDVCA